MSLLNSLQGSLTGASATRGVLPAPRTGTKESRRAAVLSRATQPKAINLKTGGSLIALVQKIDGRAEPTRFREGYVHLSSLIGGCARAHVLAIKDGMEQHRQARAAQRIVWAIGRAVEFHVRMSIIEALNFEGVLGQWSCPCRALSHEGWHRERKCRKCGHLADHYSELACYDHEARIVGSPDLVLRVDGMLLPIEIKSIALKYFDELVEAQAGHLIQVHSYKKLLGPVAADFGAKGVFDAPAIFYAAKDFSFKGIPYKEFRVPSSTALESSIRLVWEQAKAIRDAEHTLPKRLTACANCDAPTAKKCPVAVSCFARKG